MSKRTYLLPDLSTTTRVREYINQWRALGTSVASILGPEWRPVAYDPDIDIMHPKLYSIHVDRRLALAIQSVVVQKRIVENVVQKRIVENALKHALTRRRKKGRS